MNAPTTNRPTTDRSSGPAASDLWNNGKKAAAASRLRGAKRRRSIPHLMLGALLVLACAAGSLLISMNSDNRESVLALDRPVAVGEVLAVQDLRQVSVAVDPGVTVVAASQAATVVGRTMSSSLPAGALLTPDAVGGAAVPTAGQAITALALKDGQFPPEISPGAHVSVVFVASQAGTSASSPPPAGSDSSSVWPAVVTSVTTPADQQSTVVSVELSQLDAQQVAQVPAGQVSLVLLSAGGQ